MECKLKKSLYSFKQAAKQLFLRFDEVVRFFDFKQNIVDQCLYLKVNGSKFVILELYDDHIEQ